VATRCPKCQAENPETQRFCGECGTQLSVVPGHDIASPKPPRGHESKSPEFGIASPKWPTETLQMPVRELATGTTFAARYQVIEELGKGGMGRVYKVFDTDVKEKVALKLLKPEIAADNETIERFSNELKLARKIRHKNVGGMFDLGKAEGTLYLTMEFVPGEDLKRLIRRMGQFPTGKAVSVAEQISEGLSAAHHLGIVHRDLKPSNIMVDEEGNARIMDFGIARSLQEKRITGAGVMIGTPEYMSPEQVEGKDVDERSDVYSLGIILYEMLAGRVPFEGETPLSIAHKHKYEPPADPRTLNSQIPEDLSRVILRCLEKDKGKRYQTAEELRADLEKIEQVLPTTERVAARKKPFTSREITVKFNLKKLALPLFAVVVLAAAAIIVWKIIPHRKAPAARKIENSLAVISFKNQTGDPAYDYLQEAIPNLLITNLENTGLFYVATWERMQDILKQMGVKPAKTIDSDLGFELCRREGIKAIAIGSFTKAGDVFRTDVKILDAESKNLLKSANIKGTGANSILDSQIDALSREISLGLGAEKEKVEAARLNIKDITTQSLQAYDYFLKGKAAYNLTYLDEAKEYMEKALDIDPTFAMAYIYLAWANYNTGDDKARNETIEKAMAFSNKTSQKDRLYLEAGYALFIKQDLDKHYALLRELVQKYPDEKWAFHYLGDFLFTYRYDLAGASKQFEKWHELDPQDANALNHLINISGWMGDFKKAAEYIKMHDAVAPPDPYFLFVQSTMYANMGQLDKAIAKSKEALELRPGYHFSLLNLIILYGVKEEYEESIRWANEYISSASTAGMKSEAYCQRGFYHYWRGQFGDALGDFDLADKMAEQAENWIYKANALEGKGILYLAKGEFELSRTAFENELKILIERVHASVPFHKAYLAWRLGILAAEQGQISVANAKLSEMKAIVPQIEGKDKGFITALSDLLQGEAMLRQGDLDAALAAGQRACGPGSPIWSRGYTWPFNEYTSYHLDLAARIYAKKGDIAKAISEYERLLKLDEGPLLAHPLYHYRLGLLFERAKEVAKAKAQYQKFLDLWKDADPGRPEIEDAKARLAALK
jgi:serine/threonine protein kinase/Tfp pilus assembly protein PilF